MPALAIQIDAVEESFEIVAPHDAKLMDAFYSGLCELAPEVSPLFAGADMAVQKQKLLSTLLLLVDSLRDLDAIVPALHDLGAKHVTHGVEPQHHALVGSAPPGRSRRSRARAGSRPAGPPGPTPSRWSCRP
jgi:nitric oxide dioxygenase